eukprot:gene4715-5889_t
MNILKRSSIFKLNEVSIISGRRKGVAGTFYIPKPSFGQKLQEGPFRRDPENGWTALTHRVGAIGKKVGMMTSFIDGIAYPATVIELPENQVVQVKHKVNDGVDAIQLGAGDIRLKNVTGQLKGHFAKADVPPKRVLMEFKVTRNAMLPVGTHITARHFVPGQLVNIVGISSGKGFQGGMKRWNFRGQPATHGVSLTHRSIGATGCRQTPGRVFKGKKMPGRMGGVRVTEQNLQVIRVITELNCIMVKGAVPGRKGGFIKITDSRSNKWTKSPPFPTYFPKPFEPEVEIILTQKGESQISSEYPTPVGPQLIKNAPQQQSIESQS